MLIITETGGCGICGKTATFGRGDMACPACGEYVEKRCSKCTACPDCGVALVAANEVFPHSLFHAIQAHDVSALRELLSRDPGDLNTLRHRRSKYLPLTAAALLDDAEKAVEICQVLLEHGASPNAGDVAGRTPLIHSAMSAKFRRKVADLFKRSVDVQDSDGKTALMWAAAKPSSVNNRVGNVRTLQALVALGANLFITCKRGKTALDYALSENATGNNEAVVAYLRAEVKKRAESQQ